MLHIILLILKIIGLILLIVLGLLVFLLLVVLLVPVRYQLRASHGETLHLKGRVSWLLHLVQISVTHIEGVLHIRARILGFIIYDNLKPPRPKKEKAEKKKSKKTLQPVMKEKKSDLVLKQADEEKAINQTASSAISIKKEDDIEKAEDNNIELSNTELSNTQIGNTEPGNTRLNNIEKSNTEMINAETINTEFKNEKSNDAKEIIAEIIDVENNKMNKVINKSENNEKGMNEARMNEAENNPSESTEEPSGFLKLITKLKQLPERWKARYLKFCGKLQAIKDNIRSKYERFRDIITDIKHKWNLIYDFWMDELNKQGMKYTWQILKKMLKHILPTKLKSELIIGTGDPYSTGQVLSVISFFYGFYGDKVSVTPDFENSRFEGKHYARGRIRAATILIIACRLLIDKRFKYLKKNFLILKEAL